MTNLQSTRNIKSKAKAAIYETRVESEIRAKIAKIIEIRCTVHLSSKEKWQRQVPTDNIRIKFIDSLPRPCVHELEALPDKPVINMNIIIIK